MVSFARNLLSPTLFLSICFCCYLQSVIEHLITHLKLPLTLMKIYRIALGIHDDASATAMQPLSGHSLQSFTQQALLCIPTCWKHNNPSSSAAHCQVLKSGKLTCVFMYRASIARQISLHHSTVWFKGEHQNGISAIWFTSPANHFRADLSLHVPQFSLLHIGINTAWGRSCSAEGLKNASGIWL